MATFPEVMNMQASQLNHVERRMMRENCKPHEAIRQLVEVFATYQVSGDPSWPLRQIKEVLLDVMRAMSSRYLSMPDIEKPMVCQLILFEACKRYLYEIEDNEGPWRSTRTR